MYLLLYEISKKEWIFKIGGRGSIGRSFIFDVKTLPFKPEPKRIVVERNIGKYLQRYTISWKKFLNETAIGDIICINWTHFKKSVR
jgi:hypothetical protein